MRLFHRTVLAALAAFVLIFSRDASAQNLLTNYEFNTNTAGWILSGTGSLAWVAIPDRLASPSSGSALVTNSSVAASGYAFLTECFVVSPGAVIDYVTHFFIPSGQATTGGAYVAATYYADTTCSTAQLGSAPANSLGITLNSWFVSRVTGYTVLQPESAPCISSWASKRTKPAVPSR